jgi:hypothetical protein
VKVAAFISGGMDSIYACYDRLINSKDDVTAIYFDFTEILGNKTSGAVLKKEVVDIQKKVVTSIVTWLNKNIRKINLEIVPITECRYKGWWSTEVVLWAADKCNDGTYDEIISGWTWNGENINYHRAKILHLLQEKIFLSYI